MSLPLTRRNPRKMTRPPKNAPYTLTPGHVLDVTSETGSSVIVGFDTPIDELNFTTPTTATINGSPVTGSAVIDATSCRLLTGTNASGDVYEFPATLAIRTAQGAPIAAAAGTTT